MEHGPEEFVWCDIVELGSPRPCHENTHRWVAGSHACHEFHHAVWRPGQGSARKPLVYKGYKARFKSHGHVGAAVSILTAGTLGDEFAEAAFAAREGDHERAKKHFIRGAANVAVFVLS